MLKIRPLHVALTLSFFALMGSDSCFAAKAETEEERVSKALLASVRRQATQDDVRNIISNTLNLGAGFVWPSFENPPVPENFKQPIAESQQDAWAADAFSRLIVAQVKAAFLEPFSLGVIRIIYRELMQTVRYEKDAGYIMKEMVSKLGWGRDYTAFQWSDGGQYIFRAYTAFERFKYSRPVKWIKATTINSLVIGGAAFGAFELVGAALRVQTSPTGLKVLAGGFGIGVCYNIVRSLASGLRNPTAN